MIRHWAWNQPDLWWVYEDLSLRLVLWTASDMDVRRKLPQKRKTDFTDNATLHVYVSYACTVWYWFPHDTLLWITGMKDPFLKVAVVESTKTTQKLSLLFVGGLTTHAHFLEFKWNVWLNMKVPGACVWRATITAILIICFWGHFFFFHSNPSPRAHCFVNRLSWDYNPGIHCSSIKLYYKWAYTVLDKE